MAYSELSPILNRGTVSAEAIDAWFLARGPAYARYAPDQTFKPAPPLGASIIKWSNTWGVNSDLMAGQILDETGAWQSKYARERNNPGGIGAINSAPDQALFFPSPDEGVRAHLAHVCSYAKGHGEWDQFDPRQQNIINEGWLGTVHILRDLNGKWAYPGTTYGRSIADLANQLVVFAEDGTWGTPVDAIPQPDWIVVPNVKNQGGYAGTRHVLGVVNHIMDGTMQGTISWFQNPASGASSNFGIAKNGDLYLFVQPDLAAWANGPINKPDASNALVKAIATTGLNPNMLVVSKEFEGVKGDVFTDAQIATSNRLDAWLSQHYGFPISRDRIIGHYQLDSVNRPYCPGQSDAVWARLIDGAQALLNTSSPAPVPIEDAVTFSEVPYKIVMGFKDFWNEVNPGLRLYIMGFPTGNERGVTTIPGVASAQPFERGWLIYQPNENPTVTVATRELQHELESEFLAEAA